MNLDELKKAAEADSANADADPWDAGYLDGWGDDILALLTEREKLLKVVEAARASCSMNFSGGFAAIRSELKELDA